MGKNVKKTIFTLLIAIVFSCPAIAALQDSSKEAGKNNCDAKSIYLYVQTAASGSFLYNEKSHHYALQLNDIDPWIIYFSNAPKQNSGYIKASNFVTLMEKTVEEKYPKGLNAALTFFEHGAEQPSTKYILTLKNPVYNEDTHAITYSATILSGDKSGRPINKMFFEKSALFIDDMDNGAGGGGSW
jgi:hypothetical protein